MVWMSLIFSVLYPKVNLPDLQVHTFVKNTEDENVKHEGTENLC